MNINSQLVCNTNNPKKLSFKSNILYCGTVKADGDSFVKSANFSELDPENNTDKNAIKNMSEKWGKTKYFENIAKAFLNKKDRKFYAVELDGSQPLSERIVALGVVNPHRYRDYNEINFSQPAPQLLKGEEDSPIKNMLKGVKEFLIYGITKKADKKDILIYPSDDKFHFNLGMSETFMKDSMGYSFEEPKDKNEFLKSTKEKYNIFDAFKNSKIPITKLRC